MVKKQLIICFLLLILIPATVSAQAKKQSSQQPNNQGGEQQKIQDPITHENNGATKPSATIKQQQLQLDDGQASKSANRVTERVNNPEIGEQIRVMVENNQQLQAKIQTTTQTISQRNALVKFFIGPNYKNIGQARSNLADLKNNISVLEKIRDNLNPDEVEDIQVMINNLEIESASIEAQLTEKLSGFSLFGWLIERFNNN